MGRTILITGATGFLGSSLCVALSRSHDVIGLFRRQPGATLLRDAPRVSWEKNDIIDRECLDLIFRRSRDRGKPVDYVIHFAAYTGFGEQWEDEYTDTNIIGTRNMIDAACAAGVKRLLFAGSIAALEPGADGRVLTEKTRAGGRIAYSRSKALGERILAENAGRLPAVVLRLGGVFTDWCELPPLFSVMNLWSLPVIGRIVPGRGDSGFPYIHRRDVTRIVSRIIEKDACLPRFDVLFAAHSGCTRHRELFPVIRKACPGTLSTVPVNMPLPPVKLALHLRFLVNTLRRRNTYERAWMMDYVDRPLIVDTGYTRECLDWRPDPALHILERLPVLMEKFHCHRHAWIRRNIRRNDQLYEYDPD